MDNIKRRAIEELKEYAKVCYDLGMNLPELQDLMLTALDEYTTEKILNAKEKD